MFGFALVGGRYWHERVPSALESISRPSWKPADESDDDSDAEAEENNEAEKDDGNIPAHDDVIGEELHPIIVDYVRRGEGRLVIDD